MAEIQRRTPGVYVTEQDAFPASIVGVETAMPAFIGYTQHARTSSGGDLRNTPVRICSMMDYERYFGGPPKRVFTITEVVDPATPFDFTLPTAGQTPGKPKYYRVTPTSKPFILSDCLRLFFANGGARCDVVSVGAYADTGVGETELKAGLDILKGEVGPTMLVMPDAVNLDPDDENDPFTSGGFARLATSMIEQSADCQDRIAILDVFGALEVTDDRTLSAAMVAFRRMVETENLSYGAAYFPFLNTSVVDDTEVNFTSIEDFELSTGVLQDLLAQQNENENWASSSDGTRGQYVRVKALIARLRDASSVETIERVRALRNDLTTALPILREIEDVMSTSSNRLPPSAAMAGVYSSIDTTRGVWQAPANVGLAAETSPTFGVKSDQQEDLNIPLDGKAVNAIREFPGRGTLVWGARTLDGNSRDYRYVPVRRTLIYIEQSIKLGLKSFAFAANDGQTWSTVVGSCSAFLQGLWNQGGLLGSTPHEAFSVQCGLGSTMTGEDILEGYMRVQITIQMTRPAEFIELSFAQQMAQS